MTTHPEESPIRESHTEPLVRIAQEANVTDGALALAESKPDCAVYAVPNGTGGWIDVSITEFLQQVRAVAKGLIGLGIKPGQTVAVMAATSYHWAVIDQAIWFAAGISVPIYHTSSTHQIAQLLAGSGANWVFIGEEELDSKIRSAANMTEGKDSAVQTLCIGSETELQELAAYGRDVTDDQLEAARSFAGADDVATLVYTSGTTGKPKGVRITHRNLAEGAANILPFASEIVGAEGPGSRTLLFLPLAHVLARAIQLICLHRGIQVAHAADTATLLEDLSSFRPTWLLAVPRVFEKVYHGASAKAHAQGKGRIFDAARDTAVQYSHALEAQEQGTGSGPSVRLRAQRAIFSALVYSTLRQTLGGAVTHMVSGASPLNPEIAHFFTGIGVPVQEGYGLTESTAPITLNIPGSTRIGSVGLPVPGNTVKIADDGEVLLKGPVVFAGYQGSEEATAEAFDDDGYFRSGDLGTLNADGFLTLTGRKKELIVTAGGKNVYPTPLEESVRVHPLVAQVVVVGDDRPFVAALVVLDPEAVSAWAQRSGFGALSLGEAMAHRQAAAGLRAEVQAAVDGANELVSRAESIRTFSLLEAELTEESGYLTPSLKLIRHKVIEDFAEDIDQLYTT